MKGEKGFVGEKGEAVTLNWKQCVWKSNTDEDIGLI